MDVLSKISILKAATPSNGTLLNFVAHELDTYHGNLASFTEEWVAILAAAEVSYKQLLLDIAQLDVKIKKVEMEFEKVNADGIENIGLDNKKESKTAGICVSPLHKRLSQFLSIAKPKLATIKSQTREVEQQVEAVMTK